MVGRLKKEDLSWLRLSLSSPTDARPGCYTRMLRKVLNVTWKDRIPNEVLYRGLPPLSTKIRTRRLRLTGHCIRHDDVAVHSLVLWEPQRGRASRGGQRSTFIDTLKRVTGLQSTSEIRTLMLDRSLWQTTTCGSRGDSAWWIDRLKACRCWFTKAVIDG